MGTKTERELPRVGHVARPDRAWEIWNENYHRGDPADPDRKIDDLATPWVAWHPEHGSYDLPSHEAAIQVAVSFE